MRSKGSRFTLGVWGLRACSHDVAQSFATVRNGPQRFATVRVRAVWQCLLVSSAKRVTFEGFKRRVAAFRVASVALRDIQTCFAAYGKLFCAAGAILLQSFQKMRCIFRGKRVTLETIIIILRGRRSTLDVVLWLRAAWSGDKVQIPWQAWHFVRCAENWRKPPTKHRFWGCKFSGSKENS